jgi:hypothetical protein
VKGIGNTTGTASPGAVSVVFSPVIATKGRVTVNATDDEAQPPPEFYAGSPEPTAEKIATARRLMNCHREIELTRNNLCSWRLKPWPCADVRWANIVKHRAGGLDG